jgi:hypothetical protein
VTGFAGGRAFVLPAEALPTICANRSGLSTTLYLTGDVVHHCTFSKDLLFPVSVIIIPQLLKI